MSLNSWLGECFYPSAALNQKLGASRPVNEATNKEGEGGGITFP